ncbi:MAG: hypothetical protein HY051_04085 [Candidatus Aenigmarchaeota archaeon]|nr:hypothetical protein [Candidatus Aenigmarchaeota archaeon]
MHYGPKLLYESREHRIVVSSFMNFCQGLRGRTISELYVKPDGSGLFLRAGNKSADFLYSGRAFNLLGMEKAAGDEVYVYLEGREPQIEEFLSAHKNGRNRVMKTDLSGINSLLHRMAGSEIINAIIDPGKGDSVYAGPLHGNTVFSSGAIPINTYGMATCLFMDDDSLLGIRTVSVPQGIVDYAATKNVY